MQIPDDDFPYSSDDPSLAPLDVEKKPLAMSSQQLSDLKTSLRLVVGSTLSGSEAYSQRLRQIQAAQESIKPEAMVINADETSLDQLRYALIGILFETPDLIQRGLMTTERVASSVFEPFYRLLSPITNSRIFKPAKNRFDYATGRGEKVVDRLIMKGRIEEQNSRVMIQQKNVDDLINEFLEYLVLKTELMQLIQQGGVGVAGDVVDDFREQSAAVDTTLEQLIKSLFRKNVASQPDNTSSDLVKKE